MSDTPITDKARTKATELAGLSAWVLASDMRALELAANGLRDAAIERLEAKREREMKPHVTGRRCANADRELSAAIDTYNALRQG